MNTDPCWDCMQGRCGMCTGTHVDERVLASAGAPCTCAQAHHLVRASARVRRMSSPRSSFAAGFLYLLPPLLVVLIGAQACVGAALLVAIVALSSSSWLTVAWVAATAGCIVGAAWHLMAGSMRDLIRRYQCVKVIRGAAADAQADREGSDS